MIFSDKYNFAISKFFASGLLGLVLVILVFSVSFASKADKPALLMPLAAKSLVLDIANTGSRIVAVGWRGHILISDDDAQSWTQVASPTSSMLNSVYFADNLRGWAVGHDAVIISTEDGGKSWKLLSSAPEEEQPIFDLIVTGDYGFAIGAYAKFMVTQDGGKSWENSEFIIRKGEETSGVSSEEEEA
ncbi:MAG: hypothetical protein KAG92_11365, partial [Deltaproteobacteria bacterium]|nr:hypothetical protein [Deltaproteobacteria bacterium]